MNSRKTGQIGTLGVALLVVTLAGCGGVEGNYACKDGVVSSVQLKSGGNAYVTMGIFGQQIEKGGTYTVDDDKVNVVIDGDSMLFTASGKTLDGGEMFGKCTRGQKGKEKEKEKEASCESVFENMVSLAAKHAKTDQEKEEVEALVEELKDKKADAIKECSAARPSAEALRCAANAKTIDEFEGCGLPMLN